MNKFCGFILLIAILFCSELKGQEVIRGMVIDSASFTSLPGVHVKVRSSGRVAVTDRNGLFWIVATDSDTLILSLVGYTSVQVPAYTGEETMLVQLKEHVTTLREVVIIDRPMLPETETGESPTLSNIKPLTSGPFTIHDGFAVNFSYFSKLEKEKRKLIEVMEEQRRSRMYVEIVTDPYFMYEITEMFSIDEPTYYDLLATFNEEHSEMMYSSNEGIIRNEIMNYFKSALQKR